MKDSVNPTTLEHTLVICYEDGQEDLVPADAMHNLQQLSRLESSRSLAKAGRRDLSPPHLPPMPEIAITAHVAPLRTRARASLLHGQVV